MTPETRTIPLDVARTPAAHAFDALGGGSWKADPTMSRLDEVSPGLERLLGIPAERWRSEADLWAARVHPEDREATLQRRLAGADHVAEYRFTAADGRVLTLREAVRVVGGRLEGYVLDATTRSEDRTELARALARAERERAGLHELVRSVPGVVWEAWGQPDSAVQRIDYVSDHVEKMLGYTREEWLATPNFWLTIVHPDDQAEAARLSREHFLSGEPGTLRFRWRHRDGSYRWVQAWNMTIKDEEGRHVGMRGVTLDVGALVAAESAREENAERLRAALDASATGTFRWDVRTGRVEWDENLDRLFGLPPGRTARTLDEFRGFVHPEDRAAVGAALERCIREGADFDLEFRVAWPDGSVHWLLDRGRMVRDAQGAPVTMTGACVDISGRKRIEADLRRAAHLMAWQRGVLEQIAKGAPLHETLDLLCREIEKECPGRHFTVLLAEGGRLRHGAAPSLPEHYNAAVDGILIGEGVGSCGTAAFRRERVIVSDIATDPLWKDFKALALPIGLRACWSTPVTGPDGDLLGTWAVYSTTPALPQPQDEEVVGIGTRLVTIAIERARAEDALRITDERFRLVTRATNDTIWDWDLRTDSLWWNENFRQMFGYERSETASTIDSWRARIHPEDHARVKAGVLRAIEGGAETWQDEYRFLRKDGGWAHILDRGFIIRDASGKGVRMLGSMMDLTERHATERELRRVRHNLELILHSAGEGVYGVDAEGRTTFMNAAALRMLGLSEDEAIGRKLHDVIHHSHADGTRYPASSCPIYQAAHGGEGKAVKDEVFFRKDGTPVEIEYVVAPLVDGGRTVGAVTVFADVTERRRAERALRSSEAALAKAQEIAHLGSWTVDLRSATFEYSAQMRRIHGIGLDEPLTQARVATLVRPDDRERVAKQVEEVLAGRPPGPIEYRAVWRDGTVRHVEARAEIARDAQGDPMTLFGTCLDVTERRAAQESLHYHAELVRTIADNAASALFMMDDEGMPVFMNQSAAKMTGYSLDDIRGRPLHYAVHFKRPDGSPYPMEECPIDRANAEIRPLKDQRETFCRKDGTLFPVEYNVAPIVREGRSEGAVIEVRDITLELARERALTERAEQLARMTEALQRSNKELDQFAYITSHDLKAPLRGIANLSRWIEEDAKERLSDESRQHLELLRGRVNRMEALIDAILEYSRVGRVKAKAEPVDVGALVHEVVDLLAPPPGFRVEVDGGLPTLVAERMLLQQVFMNLVGNAIKHHHAKANGRVTISARDEGTRWRFTVRDNGPGIAPRFHEKIFIIFQTLEARDRVEGTGIGLALVKKIVESNGGTIDLDSDAGRGAAFSFTWPKVTEGSN